MRYQAVLIICPRYMIYRYIEKSIDLDEIYEPLLIYYIPNKYAVM